MKQNACNDQAFPAAAKRQRSASNLILSSARQTRSVCFVLASSHDSGNVLRKKKNVASIFSEVTLLPHLLISNSGSVEKCREASFVWSAALLMWPCDDFDGGSLSLSRCRSDRRVAFESSQSDPDIQTEAVVFHECASEMKTSSPPLVCVSGDGGEIKVTRQTPRGQRDFFSAPHKKQQEGK